MKPQLGNTPDYKIFEFVDYPRRNLAWPISSLYLLHPMWNKQRCLVHNWWWYFNNIAHRLSILKREPE